MTSPGSGVHESVRERALAPAPERLPAPVADAHTHLDACGARTATDVQAAMARAHAVGVTRVVTVADDLASGRVAAHSPKMHPHLYAAVALQPNPAEQLGH